MPDTQEKLTEIYDVQIYGGKQKGKSRRQKNRKRGKDKVSDTWGEEGEETERELCLSYRWRVRAPDQ